MLRSQPDSYSQPTDFYPGKSNLADKLQMLLASLDDKTRDALVALVNADEMTRELVLSSLDSQTRESVKAILGALK